MPITEFRFQSGTSNSLTLSGASSYVSPFPIKGLLQSFEFKTNTAGSLFLLQSGTNALIYSNVAPSGAAWQRIRPAEYLAIGSPYVVGQWPMFEPLILGVSGAGNATSGMFIVRYN